MNNSSVSIKVAKDLSGDFTSINEAINNAKEDSTIYVMKGVYNESLQVAKKVRIVGESKSEVVIKPTDGKTCSISKGAKIENVSFENGITEDNNKEDVPLVTIDGSVSIKNCDFNSSLNSGLAIFGGNVEITDCNFNDNKNNVRVWNHASVSMNNCNMTNAKEVGLYLDNDCYVTLKTCEVSKSEDDNIQVWGASGIVINDSTISHSKHYGLSYEEYTSFDMNNTNMSDNKDGDINKISD